MGFTLQTFFPVHSREHANYIAHTGISSRLQIKRCIADIYDLAHITDSGSLHGAKDHERRWAPYRNIAAGNVGRKHPAPPGRLENQVRDFAIETGSCCDKKSS